MDENEILEELRYYDKISPHSMADQEHLASFAEPLEEMRKLRYSRVNELAQLQERVRMKSIERKGEKALLEGTSSRYLRHSFA